MRRPWSISLISKLITEDPNIVYPEEDVWGELEDEVKKAAIEGKRDPRLEEEILASEEPANAYAYARDVIKGRWPEGEETIKKSSWSSQILYYYAVDVIKGRWPEGEERIKNSPYYAYWYAKRIIKGRWPEGEEAIKTDPELWERYQGFLSKL